MKKGKNKRKIAAAAVIILLILSPSSHASQIYEEILDGRIKSDGLFDGSKGLIYAGSIEFERGSMLTVSAADGHLICSVYDDSDGAQLTDSISFSCAPRSCRLAAVRSGSENYIMFSHDGKNDFYTIEYDRFVTKPVKSFYTTTQIASASKGKITVNTPENSVYTELNRLKESTMQSYRFPEYSDKLSQDELAEIKRTLTSCADLMKFDIRDYDYDTLFKYVLYTHDNFRIMTDLPPKFSESGQLGNGISLVSSDYIDFVMEHILRVAPKKPPVNSLLERGFCYNDGFYYYTGGFNVYFATEIREIKHIYSLGSNTYFVIFSDIYREGGAETPEYSYAMLQNTENGFALLRLGMGAVLPPQSEVKAYALTLDKHEENVKTAEETAEPDIRAVFPALLASVSVGAVTAVCCVLTVTKTKRRKIRIKKTS